VKKNELISGSTTMLVLRLLERNPMHGYEIIKTMESASKGVFELNEGTLYPILHGLESEGYVCSEWEGDTKRRRKVYTLTQKGGGYLREKQHEWEKVRDAVDTVMGGLEYAN
jgi:DNA-binding PadR family transcriptional regulator